MENVKRQHGRRSQQEPHQGGQLILLTAFIMSIGLAIIVVLANNILFSLNLPAVVKVQERIRIGDLVTIIDDEADELLDYIIKEKISEENATLMLRNQMEKLAELLEDVYADHGVAVDIEINVSATKVERVYVYNQTRGAVVAMISHEFQSGSLIIPTDDNQWFLGDGDSNNDIYTAKIFGLTYRILNSRNENATLLDDEAIPVYRLIQDPRGSARDVTNDPYGIPYSITVSASKVVDGKNKTLISPNVSTISLKGGAFLIDASDLDNTIGGVKVRDLIFQEAINKSLDIYYLNETLRYNWTVYMLEAPKIAIYPEDQQNIDIIVDYFTEAGLTENEFTLLNNTEIEQGALNEIDLLFTPHTDISDAFDPNKNVTTTAAYKILKWVEGGGVYHVECYGVETVDATIENADGNQHPWIGFIGVEPLSSSEKNEAKTINAVIMDTIFTNNATLFISQTYTVDGEIPPRSGHTPAFRFVTSHNPDTVYLANTSGRDYVVLAYAPFENGHVVYMGGHRQDFSDNVPTPSRLVLAFNAFMLAKAAKVVPAYNLTLSMTISYSDGESTFTKELNIFKTLVNGTIIEAPSGSGFSGGNASLYVNFVYPGEGYILNGTVNVTVMANGTSTSLYLDGNYLGEMNPSGSELWNFTLNTSSYQDGSHTLKAITYKNGSSAFQSITVTFSNSVSPPGTGADWEGTLEAKPKGDKLEIKLRVWISDDEHQGTETPIVDALVNITIFRKSDGVTIYSGISGLTNNDGKYEGEIIKSGDDAYWNFKKGNADYTVLQPSDWIFEKKIKYVVRAVVEKDGEIQYFEKEFEFK